MPLHLPQLSFAIKCDENELETFDAKQEGPSVMTAYVASEVGKVGIVFPCREPLIECEQPIAISNSGSPF
jgi:hypothetical protein